jgi:ATP-dependent DNA helicase RecQ
MISYFSTDNICRSSQLLYYFGEKRNDDCGQCDVCLSRKKQNNEDIKKLETEILQLLSDKKNHTKDDIYIINFPIEMIDQVLIDLIEKGQIIDDDGIISLNW